MSKDTVIPKEKVLSFIHVNPNKGNITVSSLSPVVIMKKVKLRNTDDSKRAVQLPELEDDEGADDEVPSRRKSIPERLLDNEVSLVQTMTNEEVNNHVQKCLEMSSENKISPKNAFALQLIDCLNFLLHENKDFSTMACTLDAGAKIYSYRVDALHQQVRKLADEVILHQKNKNKKEDENSEAEESGDESDVKVKKDRRRTNKKNVIASSGSLNRKFKGKDPRDRFMTMDALPGAIISGVRRDPRNLSFSLENNVQFWQDWENYKPLVAEGTVTLPSFKVVRDKVNASRQLDRFDPTQVPLSTDQIMEETQPPSKNTPISETSITDQEDHEDQYYGDIVEFDNVDEHTDDETQTVHKEDVVVIETAIKRLHEEAEASGAVSKAPSRFEAMKMLFSEASDYHYLDMKNAYYWAGPEFWKRPNGVQDEAHKKKVPRKKKEPGEICFDLNGFDSKWEKMFKRGSSLKRKTIMGWKNNKLTLPQDLKIEINMFLDLFHISRFSDPDVNTQESCSEVNCTQISGVSCNSDSGRDVHSQDLMDSLITQDPLNTSFYQSAPGGDLGASENLDPLNSAFYDVGLIQQHPSQNQDHENESGKLIKVHISTSNSSGHGEVTMVPAPKIVSFQPIKYSTRPIRVDMQHLKETMLGIIDQQIEEVSLDTRMDCDSGPSGADDSAIPETKFSSILNNMPGKLQRRTAQDLSSPMAFLALLTLANENNLQLKNCENNTDVIIRKPKSNV